MSNLPIFSHPSFGTVRIVERNDEPWFVAKDVLKALGYAEDYNPSRALQAVPEEWKGVQPIHTPGGMQEMLIISEQGLYFFLGRSDKPVALPFQKWLAGDVIPSIRKHGLYARPRCAAGRERRDLGCPPACGGGGASATRRRKAVECLSWWARGFWLGSLSLQKGS